MQKVSITYLGGSAPSIHIKGEAFYFSYTPADDVVKPEYKGKYRYFGGLQSEYEEGSKNYEELHEALCQIAEKILDEFYELKFMQL